VTSTHDTVVTRDAQGRVTSNTGYINGQQQDRTVWEYR
jgi:hypothetical protein